MDGRAVAGNIKAIAFYLPQYHRIPENDEWWGEGYTEWTAVRNARPLFKGHYQPRVPLNGIYYDLLDPSTPAGSKISPESMVSRVSATTITGSKASKPLERPFEHVLKTKELTLPFCLSWANQSWTRTWYGQATTVLVAQEYGDRIDRERHFEYLLPAFKDERYITVDDRPLFIIHDSADIPDCADRLTFWNDLARRNGLKGLYLYKRWEDFL